MASATGASTSREDGGQSLSLNPDDIVIMLMGLTGSGKSTFIQLLVDDEVKIGHGLASCTANVEIYGCSDESGRSIWLIDTPGLNDSTRKDAEILKEISFTLTGLYTRNIPLTGIVYMHNLAAVRMGGSGGQSLRMLKAMCGNSAFPHIALTGNKGDGKKDEDHIQELLSEPEWWGDMAAGGSPIVQHTGDVESAKRILQTLITARDTGLVLSIQDELVNKHLSLDKTQAGIELNREIHESQEQWRAEMKQLYIDAQQERDQQHKQAFETQREELQRVIEEAHKSQQLIKISLEKLAEEKTAEISQRLLEAQQSREADLAAWKGDRAKLQSQMEQSEQKHLEESRRLARELDDYKARAASNEQRRLEKRIRELERQRNEEKLQSEKKMRNLNGKIAKKEKNKKGSGWGVFQVLVGIATICAAGIAFDPALAMSGVNKVTKGFSGGGAEEEEEEEEDEE